MPMKQHILPLLSQCPALMHGLILASTQYFHLLNNPYQAGPKRRETGVLMNHHQQMPQKLGGQVNQIIAAIASREATPELLVKILLTPRYHCSNVSMYSFSLVHQYVILFCSPLQPNVAKKRGRPKKVNPEPTTIKRCERRTRQQSRKEDH